MILDHLDTHLDYIDMILDHLGIINCEKRQNQATYRLVKDRICIFAAHKSYRKIWKTVITIPRLTAAADFSFVFVDLSGKLRRLRGRQAVVPRMEEWHVLPTGPGSPASMSLFSHTASATW